MRIARQPSRNRFYRFIWAALLILAISASANFPKTHLSICVVQGRLLDSRYDGLPVNVEGIVTIDLDETYRKGFFIQDENCDGDPSTSDAIFIYIGDKADVVSVGDHVIVRGWVNEFYGLTEISARPNHIEIIGQKPLPDPVGFSPPWSPAASAAYFEAHEGMRITMADVTVVGPSTARGEAYAVASIWNQNRVYHGADAGTVVKIGGETPDDLKVGDRLSALSGYLDFQRGEYVFFLEGTEGLVVSMGPPGSDLQDVEFSFATLNLHNLFDTEDDPATSDPVPGASVYRRKLEKLARVISGELRLPLFIAVQEAENGDVLQALANRPEFPVRYAFEWYDGPDKRGIDVGLLYRTDRVKILHSETRQGCTMLIDGLGPDGNHDMERPENAVTCDLDQLPGNEGNRLFSRPPLVVRLEVCDISCDSEAKRTPFWVVAFHLKSKFEDSAFHAYTEQRRIEQANFLAEIYTGLRRVDPNSRVVLAGDFNDFPDSKAAARLGAAGLVNLMAGSPQDGRYTYIFRGISQVLDQVFVSPNIAREGPAFLQAFPLNIASDFPAGMEADPATALRASDHDPVLVRQVHISPSWFLPALIRAFHSP